VHVLVATSCKHPFYHPFYAETLETEIFSCKVQFHLWPREPQQEKSFAWRNFVCEAIHRIHQGIALELPFGAESIRMTPQWNILAHTLGWFAFAEFEFGRKLRIRHK